MLPARHLLAAALVLAATACQGPLASPAPSPTVNSAAGAIKCPAGDHGLDEVELGWGFCYPGTWRYRERLQDSTQPAGVDATFDIVNDLGTPAPGQPQSPENGLFGFMIIGTYEKGGASTLTDWAAANLGDGLTLTPITWGNSQQAYLVEPLHERIAFTKHHVVVMEVHEGQGNLALDDAMAKRLATWRFDF